MKKKLSALLLALIIMISLLPMPVGAADSDARLRATIAKQFDAYAASIYQADAHNGAVKQMINHSLTRPNQVLNMDEDDGFTASLFHSNLFREYMIEALTLGTQQMQDKHLDKALIGSFVLSWHDHALLYRIGQWEYDHPDPRWQEMCNYFTNTINYSGSRNQNDKTMILLAGGVASRMDIQRIASDLNQITYRVNLTVCDDFDFDNDYSGEIKAGYDVSTSLLISSVGDKLLNPYRWYSRVSFDITVPNTCDHTPNAFRWEANGKQLQSLADEFWMENTAQRAIYSGKGTERERAYFNPQQPIALYHDRPWIIEFTLDEDQSFILAQHPWYATPSCRHLIKDNVRVAGAFGYSKEQPDPVTGTVVKGDDQYGINFVNKGIAPSAPHTYRLENRIAPDGSNMIYLLIDGLELGSMTEYSVYDNTAKTTEDMKTLDNRLAGKDFYISYIFNKAVSCPIDVPLDYLEVYESGLNVSTFVETYTTEATCTQPAADVWHCIACGAAVRTPTAEPMGHSFGEYVFDQNSTCTADGTQTRKCIRCDVTETMAAPDTATGHSHKAAVTEPTCTERGYTTYTCACGDTYNDDYTDATGHNHKMTITAPTCTQQGYTTYTCHCGDQYVIDYTDPEGHVPVIDPAVPASCMGNGLTEGSHCEVCRVVLKEQTVVVGGTHLKDEGTIIKEPTYDAPGTVMYQCIYCGEKSYVVLPKLEAVVNPFTDVKESDWFYKPVMWAVQNGVTGGKTATTFAPYEGCTRAQVVTFLWAANGKPMPKTTENPFADVKTSDWYYNAVLWAVENGITGGISADKFGPNQTCTRAQIATFLWAAKGKPAVSDLDGFTDVAATDWFAAPVIWAKEQGITDGIGGGMFGPNDTCTRGQVVTFLNKVYG